VIVGRNPEALENAQALLAADDVMVTTVTGDVSEPNSVASSVSAATELVGTINVLVNNAGGCHEASVIDTSDDVWQSLLQTNLTGVFLMSRSVAQHMIERGTGGVIINTSSINSTMSERLYVPYSATKAGVDALTRGLAAELAPHGIRVVGVRPGIVETPMISKVLPDPEAERIWRETATESIPLRRFASPDELAGAYLFLASPDASYITGSDILVDGGIVATASS
jgi:NAD(P)-dependent dehydrogenase (short-subunit alcohol dehydrogenase family)